MTPKLLFSTAIFALASACVAIPARGNGIELLSCSLETHGNWRESWFIGEDPYEFPDKGTWYNPSGTFSAQAAGVGALSTISASGPNNWERAYSRIDSFNLEMWADSAPRDFGIPGGFGGFPGEEINIYSTATTQFRVTNTRLLFDLSGAADYDYEDWEQDMQVTLRDITSSQTLLSLADLDHYPAFAYDYSFAVNPTHVYELDVFGRINSWDAKYAVMSSSVRMASVPDSGSTLPLSALTLLSLLVFRKLSGWSQVWAQ